MNTRQRKKYLKKKGLYVNPRETWDLEYNISKYILPRLILFKKLNNGYPGHGDMDTPEKWDEALDKMIAAFQLSIDADDLHDKYWEYEYTGFKKELWEEDQAKIKEGLHLFAEWFQNLWW